ncbi:MAG: hypothetical protein ABSA75_13480 [Candidatus Bathyarchaeia archaeon]|jgi:hypothetical protein
MSSNPNNASQLSGLKGFILREDSSGNLGFFFGNIEVFTLNTSGIISKYNNIATVGLGDLYANYSAVGKAALVANAINYTPPAVAGTYRLFVNVNVHTAAASNMAVTVTFKDAGGNAQSFVLTLLLVASTTVYNQINNVTGIYYASLIFQIDNSATAITVSTTGTTMTLYDFAATLEQVA